MYINEVTYRVTYADVDQMGYMYYGNYAKLYEIGRTESIRAIGFPYKTMEDHGIMMPVYENYSKFLQPALYDDLLTIKVTIKENFTVKAIFFYEIFNQNKELLHTGSTTLVFLKKENNKIVKAPNALINKLKEYIN
ncbi:MAG: acyl-CoA thioesterase [Pseudarcicella sp.]|nr:acyl-CoA thioesterase [Pseudarcicella sp.]MBP6409462.1 acyl-CoA thioesterase [Pseudarcicella sp.]